MAFTRIHDEPCRIKKELQQMTDIGKYMITTPGPGANVGFAEDPHIRLQRWGANLRTNTINTESDLLGLTRPLTKDCQDINQYDKMKVSNERLYYGTIAPNTEETRAIMPPWTTKDARIERWQYLHQDPQEHIQNVGGEYGGRSSRIHNKNEYNIHCSYLRN
jgi:hypothetical protein